MDFENCKIFKRISLLQPRILSMKTLRKLTSTGKNESTKCKTSAQYYRVVSMQVNEHVNSQQRWMSAVCNSIQTVLKIMCATYSESLPSLISYTQSALVLIEHQVPVSYYNYVQCGTTHVRSLYSHYPLFRTNTVHTYGIVMCTQGECTCMSY